MGKHIIIQENMPRRNRPKSAKAVVKKVMNAKQHEWMK